MEQVRNFFREIKTPFSWQRIWVSILVIIVITGIGVVAFSAYAASYNDRVLPGVHVGAVSVGGMNKSDLVSFLQDMNNKLVAEGFAMIFDDGEKEHELLLYPVVVVEGDSIELMHMDVDRAADTLVAYGKEGDIITRGWRAINTRWRTVRQPIEAVSMNVDGIRQVIADFIEPMSSPARNAGVRIIAVEPLQYEVVTSSAGIVYAYEEIPQQLRAAWAELRAPELRIHATVQQPSIVESDIHALESRLPSLFDDGALTLTYADPQTRVNRDWVVPLRTIGSWLTVTRDPQGNISIGFDEQVVRTYLEKTVASAIAREPRDAKFSADENGRVIEFQASRPGLAVDIEATYQAMNNALAQRLRHDEGVTSVVTIALSIIEPHLTTGEVNDLGIQEILGVGISDLAGSPRNRILNIKNGMKKINGVIIQPGEEFSAIEFTKPYTEDGGYLPELVIKGDEIKPEIGGGLCQIGTTLFRMAMNSGMEITQRRNHSLVVSYYNDLVNGNPGTDATIYEPAPDFRFRNDTNHAILIQTAMDEENSRLIFTLWGTNDGREASYSRPVVKRWIPFGETKIVKTTKLPPGKRECQHAYRGAETTFTYTRTMPDGTVQDRVFDSYYRPLPEICLVGAKEGVENTLQSCEEGVCLSEEERAALSQNQFNPDGSPVIVE